jgi:hypothetical protein
MAVFMHFFWSELVFPFLFFVLAALIFLHQGTWVNFRLQPFDPHHITYTSATVALGLGFLIDRLTNEEEKTTKPPV